jgi:hypothetical protein
VYDAEEKQKQPYKQQKARGILNVLEKLSDERDPAILRHRVIVSFQTASRGAKFKSSHYRRRIAKGAFRGKGESSD